MMASTDTKSNKARKSFEFYFLLCLAILASLYEVFTLLPVFHTRFPQVDFPLHIMGAKLLSDPTLIFSYTYQGWYRPLGFTIPGLLFNILRFNLFPSQLLGILAHFFCAFCLFLFVRRLFDQHKALLAYTLFVVSATSLVTAAYTTNIYQDSLATSLILLCFASMLKQGTRNPDKPYPYWCSALWLFLSANCKETWLAALPVIVFLDFVNYKKMLLIKRVLRLLPFLASFILILLKFHFASQNNQSSNMLGYLQYNLTIDTVISGLVVPFMPFFLDTADSIWFWLRLIVPALILLMFLLNKQAIKAKLLVVTGFLSLLLFLIPSSLMLRYWADWAHLIPLTAFAMIMLSSVLWNGYLALQNSPQSKVISRILICVLVGGYAMAQGEARTSILYEARLLTSAFEEQINSINFLVQQFPSGTHVYSIGGIPTGDVQGLLYREDIRITCIVKNTKEKHREYDQNLVGCSEDYFEDYLHSLLAKPETRIIAKDRQRLWKDITEIKIRAQAGDQNAIDSLDQEYLIKY